MYVLILTASILSWRLRNEQIYIEAILVEIRNFMNTLISEKKKEVSLEKSKLREEVVGNESGNSGSIGCLIRHVALC